MTAALTTVSGSPFALPSGTSNYGLAVDAAGKFLYAGTNTATMVALAINQTTGALTAAPGSPFAGSGSTFGVTTTGAVVGSTATLQSTTAISPASPTIMTAVLGKKLQLVLLGHYSDGTTQFLTESAAWSSSATGIATIANSAGSKGLNAANSSTTITATAGGQTATATLAVQQPTVTSIVLTPASPTIASGTAIQLSATATYSDGSTQTIAAATWSSSNTSVATVGDSASSKGLATSIAAGSATISATYNGASGTTAVTVTAVSGAAGRFVYTANQTNWVFGYILDQATGGLTAVPGSPASSPSNAYAIASHPSGRYVYVGYPLWGERVCQRRDNGAAQRDCGRQSLLRLCRHLSGEPPLRICPSGRSDRPVRVYGEQQLEHRVGVHGGRWQRRADAGRHLRQRSVSTVDQHRSQRQVRLCGE